MCDFTSNILIRGIFFFGAFGEMVLAGVFSQWYWTLDKKNDLPSCALGTSLWNTTVFHLGTVAFGSLIIAIIRMIRTILEYIEKKLKKFNNDLTKYKLKNQDEASQLNFLFLDVFFAPANVVSGASRNS